MADAVIRVGGETIQVVQRGAQGPRGFNGPDLTELAGPEGAAEIGFSAGAGATTETIEQILRQCVRVTSYGASPSATGATNAAAFNVAAVEAGVGGCVIVPAGTYPFNGTADILEGQHWVSEGAVISQAANAPTFRASGIKDWSLRGARVVGTRSGGDYTDNGQDGLLVEDCIRFVVDDFQCDDCHGAGIRQTGAESVALRGEGGSYNSCSAFRNAIGRQLVAGPGTEFTSWTNWTASGNYDGDDISAGNVSTNGGSVSDNINIGIKLTGGANDGHGGYENVTVAHNGVYQIYAVAVLNGYLFVGCRFYDGSMAFIGCAGIVLADGFLAVPNIYNRLNGDDESVGTNYILRMYCPGTGVDIKRTEIEHDKNLVVLDCVGPGAQFGGITINSSAPVAVHAERAPGALQTLSGSAQLMTFPTVPADGDHRGAWDGSTYTAIETGRHVAKARCIFTPGAGTTDEDSFIYLYKNGDAIDPYLPDRMRSGMLTISVLWSGHLTEGDTLDLRATLNGTDPKFGLAGNRSWISIERIA